MDSSLDLFNSLNVSFVDFLCWMGILGIPSNSLICGMELLNIQMFQTTASTVHYYRSSSLQNQRILKLEAAIKATESYPLLNRGIQFKGICEVVI